MSLKIVKVNLANSVFKTKGFIAVNDGERTSLEGPNSGVQRCLKGLSDADSLSLFTCIRPEQG